MTIVKLPQDFHSNTISNLHSINASMSYSQDWQTDRWQQPNSGSDYAAAAMSMSGMVYDHRTLPSTTTMQPSTMAPQYSLPTTYDPSPMTPMVSSSYGSQEHYRQYQTAYSYQEHSPATSSYADHMTMRHSQRPTAPPTPPMEDDHSMRYHEQRPVPSVKSSIRRNTRRSVSVAKSEASSTVTSNTIKTCPKYVKADGATLQYESKKKFDQLLKQAEMVIPIRLKNGQASAAATPESMAAASPPAEEVHTPGVTTMAGNLVLT